MYIMSESSENSKTTKTGICSVKGFKNKNKAKINYLGNVDIAEGQYVPDELVKRIDIGHRVSGEVYKCNITHHYLMSSKKLPLCYTSVVLEAPLQKVLLLQIYINFIIESDIKNENDLLNRKIKGRYTLDLVYQNSAEELDKLDLYPGDEEIYDKFEKFLKSDDMEEFIKSETNIITEKLREQYKGQFKSIKPPTNIKSLEDYDID